MESIPPVEFEPPYSLDFVAHLHGGCYPDDISPGLMHAVRCDDDGARVLDTLTITPLELFLLGPLRTDTQQRST